MDLSMNAKHLLEIKEHMDIHGINTYSNHWELKVFYQCWCNTSGGLEGIGGSAMSNQPTYVLLDKNIGNAYVFFNGKYAYRCKADANFYYDLQKENIAGVKSWMKRYEPI